MSSTKKRIYQRSPNIQSYNNFWSWFLLHEKKFFQAVKKGSNIEKEFFDKLAPKLNQLKEGFFFLTGMLDDTNVELILTADGNVKNLVFVEELIAAAPSISGWKFTAHKPPLDIENVNISMDGYEFTGENLSFYSTEYPQYPDEIDITVIHRDFKKKDKDTITNGIFIFLDNYLGELNLVSNIDTVRIVGPKDAEKQPIPIERLKSFLQWRQKEFIEKYDAVRYESVDDDYSVLDGEMEDGQRLVAVINRDLLNWDSKASHPWMLKIRVEYEPDGEGMPGGDVYDALDEFENHLITCLKAFEGNLFIGRQTSDGVREIYFACKDFRKPAKVMHESRDFDLKGCSLDYDLYLDKYWQSFNRFTYQP